ncbi:DUF2339 domain-containing protein [Hyalangium rubrum]|uniref:DUF2339 domain-containing protein n=1 Tax=Hyalangium rubrum TaxID=3103134 RepID=A0ABU5H729_9BACT|nr:DUF2339 domain-containing protein [Hyalangium sp. s54d21]MDY7229066.1 DUF2339 domain-containing protein [Hyalangium sp. s54d21]
MTSQVVWRPDPSALLESGGWLCACARRGAVRPSAQPCTPALVSPHAAVRQPLARALQCPSAIRRRTRMNGTKWDVRVLAIAGVGLLALAAVFLWRDLQVPSEMLLGVVAVGAVGLAAAGVPRERPLAGPILVLTSAVLGGAWYAATKSGLLLIGLAVTLVAAAFAVWRSRRSAEEPDRVQSFLTWYGLTAAAIAASWAFYFHFLTLGFAEDDVARRLVLTLGWLVAGVALVLHGRKRGEAVIRDAGFAFVAISLGKALIYDTTHLSGTLRVVGLAGAGLLMLGGAYLSTRSTARSA